MAKQSQQQKTNNLTARVVIEDDRLTTQAIVWPVGSDELLLVHKSGTDSEGEIMKRTFNKGGISDAQHAQDLAQGWFDSLLGIFADENQPDEYED